MQSSRNTYDKIMRKIMETFPAIPAQKSSTGKKSKMATSSQGRISPQDTTREIAVRSALAAIFSETVALHYLQRSLRERHLELSQFYTEKPKKLSKTTPTKKRLKSIKKK